jgi:hypothetical protein
MKITKKWGMVFLLGVVLIFGAMLAGCDADEALAPPADGDITYTADQVGGHPGSATTSAIKLNFDADVSGLSASNIRIEGDAVTSGGLSGGPKVWNLALDEVAEECEVTLVVNKDGIDKEPKQVQVYTAPPLTGTVVIGGDPAVGQTLTANISALNGSGTISYRWIQGASTIIGSDTQAYKVTAADFNKTIKVEVRRAGYSGTVTSAATTPCDGGGYTLAVTVTPDLKTRFGTTDVATTFTALHNLIAAPRLDDNFAVIIQLGDWIDLPSLRVEPDEYGGAINVTNTVWDEHSASLRLIVVGINSFATTDVNDVTDNAYNRETSHVVFQFQNVPGEHCMEAGNTNENGYRGSKMRAYITNNFLTGLRAAGVPDAVLWAPRRCVANRGTGATTADIIADELWLPTAWEMFGTNSGSNTAYETLANQASFIGFYTSPGARTKYRNNLPDFYWLASPYSSSTATFCSVGISGAANYYSASGVRGVAPAFCVR